MPKREQNYSHFLEFDEHKRTLTIYRIHEDGTKRLFTAVDLPRKTLSEDEQGFRSFAQMLGENLLVDSPVARRLLGL